MPDFNKRLHNRSALKERRRELRAQATPAEAELWKYLKKSQLQGRKFRRQHSIGPYVVDFYCPAEKLAVELDGEVHSDPARRDYDAEREAFLHEHGIDIVRFANQDVFNNMGQVLEGICWHFQK